MHSLRRVSNLRAPTRVATQSISQHTCLPPNTVEEHPPLIAEGHSFSPVVLLCFKSLAYDFDVRCSEAIYVDHGLTGTNRASPGLNQALAVVRKGDTLIVPKLDRLARSVPDARFIADE